MKTAFRPGQAQTSWPIDLPVRGTLRWLGLPLAALLLVPGTVQAADLDAERGGEKVPAPSRPAEKLPIDLPELKVIGHEVKPDVSAGAKLPLDASASVSALPPPPPARATTELLDKLRLPVPPPPDAELEGGVASDRIPYSSVWTGLGSIPLGGLHTGIYDFGFYHGRRVGPVVSITDFGFGSHGLDRWSSLRLDQQFAWNDTAWASFGLRREQQTPGVATALQEGVTLQASWAQGPISFHLDGVGGHLESGPVPGPAAESAGGGEAAGSAGGGGSTVATGAAPSGSTWLYGMSGTLDFEPDLWFDDHLIKLGLQLGHLGATGPAGAGWASPLVAARASDRFHPRERTSVDAELGLTLFRQATYLDPSVRLTFRPGDSGPSPPWLPGDSATLVPGGAEGSRPPGADERESPTELWLGLGASTRIPDFETTYLSRLRTVGNADLRPQQTQPRLELGAGHRFTDRLYGTATAGAARVVDGIHYAPVGAGLWQPRNFAVPQTVLDLGFDSQYLWSETVLQRFDMKIRNQTGLGERQFSAGTGYESLLLDGQLAVSVGTRVDYVELGATQGGGQGVDWRTDWEIGYRIAPAWQLYVAGRDWHVWQQEPSAGYFAAPARITAGFKVDF